MQCLKCDKEAVRGKALCAECLAVDTARNLAQSTPEWERSIVDATRESFGRRGREEAFSSQRFGKELRNALAVIFALLAILLFIYWIAIQPESAGRVWAVFERKEAPPVNKASSPKNKIPQQADTPTAAALSPASNIRITSPADGALFSSTNPVSFVAVAADPDNAITSVRFIHEKQVLCAVYRPPYKCAWTQVTPGTFTIHAEAFNSKGATVQSDPITIDVFATLPGEGSFSFTRPTNGATFLLDPAGATINVPVRATFKSQLAATKVTATIPNGTCTSEGINDMTASCSLSEPGNFLIRLTATLINGAEVSGTLPIKAVRVPTTDGSQQNPYYSTEELSLSAVDWGAPNANAPLDPLIQILPESERLFVYLNPKSNPSDNRPFGAMTGTNDNNTAGSFDDVVSIQNSENAPPFSPLWRANSQPTRLSSQALVFTGTSAMPLLPDQKNLSKYGMACLANRGITFNSRSHTDGGHSVPMSQLSDSSAVERDSFFQNTLQTTPSGRSYGDTFEDETIDSYDSLFTHLLTTMGEIGSDFPAINKLTIAASALPPETKRRLKATGNYAAALQWLWRASLPYADGAGNPLPFGHELRHRPVYLATGEQPGEGWFSYNSSYHQYNEGLHMREMLRLASTFGTATPPVTIMSLVDYSVTAPNGQVLETSNWDVGRNHIKLMLPTTARVWGKQDEKVSLRINFAASYDLLGEPLTYHVAALYPEQSSLIQITQEGPTQFVVSASYSDRFPRSRIPVIATARNRTMAGTPAFITFLWPNEAVTDSSLRNFYNSQDPSTHVNRNRRPLISRSSPEPTTAKVGDDVRLSLACSDPEGFTTSWSRWAGEPGTLIGSEYHLSVGPELRGRSLQLHFICSDGTGGYSSTENTIVVAK
jgi:hypothetical protein